MENESKGIEKPEASPANKGADSGKSGIVFRVGMPDEKV